MIRVPSGARRERRVLRVTLLCVVLLAACHPVRGCAESQFTLAPESRLPKWFALPAGVQRGEVEVSLTYYPAPLIGSEPVATVTFDPPRGSRQEVVATPRTREPQTLQPYTGTGPIPYPMYAVLTANGITEVIEHRRMEPVFYISDDLEVRRKLGVIDK